MALPVVTPQEMAAVDSAAIQQLGIPSACLMELAGARAAEAIAERWAPIERHRIAVVAGRGNNGGDGFVIARHLLNRGAQVDVYTLFPPEEAQGDARTFLEVLRRMGVTPRPIADPSELEAAKAGLSHHTLFVDAIFGTGFTPPARGLAAEVIEFLQTLSADVAAVDIPSGLDGATGAVQGPHLRAALTVTFGALKRGHLLYPAAHHVGEVVTVDIGIPRAAFDPQHIALHLTEASDIASLLPRRPADAHKGTAGHLLAVGGSRGKTGAPLMAALGALRAGAGLVTLGLPQGVELAPEVAALEAMSLALPATPEGTLDPEGLETILAALEDKQGLVLGPGLTTHPRTVELVQKLILNYAGPIVLDADGLNALAQDMTVLEGRRAKLLLTPHPGEMGRLVGRGTAEIQADRVGVAIEFAIRHQVDLALKGARTIVAEAGGRAWMNPAANPGLATAGTGDVLAGVVGGLLVQGLAPTDALRAGVYLHGLAGELAAQEVGPVGFTATDLLPRLARAQGMLASEGGAAEATSA
ncbi:MAG: NAD(P)H-hydrate dehydratase [Nitrospinota bacterium]